MLYNSIVKIFAVQLNSKVGDIDINLEKMRSFYETACKQGAELVVFPELCVIGYPPLDLLENRNLIKSARKASIKFASLTSRGPACIFGLPVENTSGQGKPLYNCAIFAENGKISKIVGKALLPTYDIFDEARYFESWDGDRIVNLNGAKIGLTVCEDIWGDTALLPNSNLYKKNPLKEISQKKPDLIINISASPFHKEKPENREKILSNLAKKIRTKILYVNCCGANDELIFDGGSFLFSSRGEVLHRGEFFIETAAMIDTHNSKKQGTRNTEVISDIKSALVMGIKDYFHKQGFKKAVIGLSGGIDSAVVADLACEAIGNENVLGLLMPSPYTSQRSINDALKLAKNLTIKSEIKYISKIYSSFLKELGFSGGIDLSMQNLQSRIRGSLLMAYSNKYGYLALTTGNKSEIAMGYCTLYGDTAGAIAPIGDLLKTEVYQLADFINRQNEKIPLSIINRAPTAELKPNQKDQDDLPPYDILDKIIRSHIEQGLPFEKTAKICASKELAKNVIRRIESNEYKRKQLPLCLKVSSKSFGSGRKMPIVKKNDFFK